MACCARMRGFRADARPKHDTRHAQPTSLPWAIHGFARPSGRAFLSSSERIAAGADRFPVAGSPFLAGWPGMRSSHLFHLNVSYT